MAKSNKKRAIVYSNVKKNKKRAEEITKIKDEHINLNDEIIIGMSSQVPKKSSAKSKKNSEKKNKKPHNNNPQKNNKKVNNVKKKKIIISFLFLIIIILIVVGIICFMKSSFFNINKINVKIENNKILTEAEIKDLSTINIGQNIYSINKKDIINSIKNNSYVENVKIKRKLPNAIEIQIEERTPKYQLKSDSQYIYIDEQGYILEVTSDAKDLTTIVGYQTTDFTIGNKIEENDIEKINNIPQIIQELEKNNLLNELTSIDIKDKNDYIVNFENLHKLAHLGNMTSLNEKMNFVKEIMSKEQDYEGEVFVNVDLNNGEYPYFREKV